MARGKAIQVKIATAKVIQALETKLAQVEADYTHQDELEAKFNKMFGYQGDTKALPMLKRGLCCSIFTIHNTKGTTQ